MDDFDLFDWLADHVHWWTLRRDAAPAATVDSGDRRRLDYVRRLSAAPAPTWPEWWQIHAIAGTGCRWHRLD